MIKYIIYLIVLLYKNIENIIFNNISNINKNNIMTTNLYSFDNNGNINYNKNEIKNLINENNKNKSVICIVGQTRMGKSSYLNCIHYYITGENKEIFKTIKGDEHCTKNVNIYNLESYILIDCQGLKYENSYNDDKLLLIAYSLSDIIIINGINTLDNTLLSLIEPISVFSNYLEKSKPKNKKPKLCFRIKDYDDNFDINKQLKKLLNEDNQDNYNTLRKVIKILFESVSATYTYHPNRNERKELDTKKYNNIINNNEIHFKESIEYILNLIDENHTRTLEQFINNTKNVYNDIKQGINAESFNMKEADLSKMIFEKKYQTFYDNITKENDNKYNRSVVDNFKNLPDDDEIAKNHYYLNNFMPEINKIFEIIKNAHKKFDDNEPEMLINMEYKLFNHLTATINVALQKRVDKITEYFEDIDIESIIDDYLKMYKKKIKNYPNIKNYEEIDFDLHCVSKIKDYILEKMSDYRLDDALQYINVEELFKKHNINAKKLITNTMEKILKNEVKVSSEIYDKTIELNNKYEEFINLINFDADYNLINHYFNEFNKDIKKCKVIHNDNLKIIETCKENLTNLINERNNIDNLSHFILNNKNNINIKKNFSENIENVYKDTISNELKNIDSNLNIINTIEYINTSPEQYECTIEFTNHDIIDYNIDKKNYWKKVKNFCSKAYKTIKYILWEDKYNEIDFNKLFNNTKIINLYKNICHDKIKNYIKNNTINYDDAISISENNPDLKFIIFKGEKCCSYILRNYCVPNQGYMLIHNDDYNKSIKIFDSELFKKYYDINTIIKYFGNIEDNKTIINIEKNNSDTICDTSLTNYSDNNIMILKKYHLRENIIKNIILKQEEEKELIDNWFSSIGEIINMEASRTNLKPILDKANIKYSNNDSRFKILYATSQIPYKDLKKYNNELKKKEVPFLSMYKTLTDKDVDINMELSDLTKNQKERIRNIKRNN